MEAADVVIVGGGPAGLAAAVALRASGIERILVLEREKRLGGILRQCIHDGFGLARFKESLSGPEYAKRFIDLVEAGGITCLTDTMVLDISAEKRVIASSAKGIHEFEAKTIVLATGCRERPRGALTLPGDNPAGIYMAGVAQAYINLHNMMVGREAVILGSGDIGMIMARRLTLEGATVRGVFEILPYTSGLSRNKRQCLDDFDIPLYLSHTVTKVRGSSRLEAVTVAEVDSDMRAIPGTEREIPCDTLILSVGLIPENEVALGAGVELDPRTGGPLVDEHHQSTVPGIFSAGNALHVHDLVDYVSLEAEELARSVALYLREGGLRHCGLSVSGDATVLNVLPQRISGKADFVLSLRVKRPYGPCEIRVSQGGRVLKTRALRKALPAEMIRLPMRASELVCEAALEVAVTLS